MDWLKKLENIKKFYQEPGFVLPGPRPTEQAVIPEPYGWDFMAQKSSGPREGSTVHEFKDALTEKLVPDLGISYKSPKGWSIGAGPWAGEGEPSVNFQFRKEFDDGGRVNLFFGGTPLIAEQKQAIINAYNNFKKQKKFLPNLSDVLESLPKAKHNNLYRIKQVLNEKKLKYSSAINPEKRKAADKIRVEAQKEKANPFKNNKAQENKFIKDIEKRYRFAKRSDAAKKAGVLSNPELAKKYGVSERKIDRLVEKYAKDLSYPKQTYEGDKAVVEERLKRKKDLRKEVSGLREEQKIADIKRPFDTGRKKYKGIDLAHKASLEQFKDLGLKYNVTNLGLDQQKLNQQIIRPTEEKMESLHKQRMKLIENVDPGKVPKNIQKQLEQINIKMSNLSSGSNGMLQAVLIDEKNLKPFVFNKDYSRIIGQGLLNKPVEKLTQADLDLIKIQMPEQVKTTKRKLPLNLDDKQIINVLKAIGCPGKAMGGRVGFQTGANCMAKGVEAINSGKIAKGAQARNAAKFLNKAYKLGRGVMKLGVIPEALFVAGESLVRMGMGDTLDEALLRSVDWITPGDQTRKADLKMLTRTIGSENAQTVLRANDYKDSLQRFNDAKVNAEVDLAQNMEEFSGESDEAIRIRNEQRVQEAEADIKAKFQPEAVMDYATMQESEAEDIRKSNSKIRKFMETARQNEVDDFEQVATPEKVKKAADPMFTMDDLARHWIPDEFLKSEQDRMGAPELKKRNLFDYYRGDEDFNKDVWKAVMEGGRSSDANRERLFGTQGTFGGQPLAGGGIAGVRRPNAIAPESGPAPQGEGLSYILNRVREW